MIFPNICIIVPTRERADTLVHTLRTCVQQEYSNLQILVCDNFSQDNTKDVVDSFHDIRIKYIRTERRLTMTDNWEFAISHVNADFVTILGDDDGFLPNSITDLVDLLMIHHQKIITWSKAEYCWPNHIDPNLKGFISVPLRNKLVKVKSETALKHIYKNLLSYNHGPCIYNSIVSMECIIKIIQRDGFLFQSGCPDVYSSLALASVTEDYLYSTRPFSINGASAHSNGTSQIRIDLDSTASDLFQKEIDVSAVEFLKIRGSINSAIADSLINFSTKVNIITPKINYKKIFKRIYNDLSRTPGAIASNQASLKKLADKYKIQKYCESLFQKNINNPSDSDKQKLSLINTSIVMYADTVIFWGDRFDIKEVNLASIFIGKILGKYVQPSEIIQYSLLARIMTRMIQKIAGFKYCLEM